MLGGAASPGGDELLTVVVLRDEHGYGMKVSGDNPVYVQSVKEAGAAWRAGLRAGDRIEEVNGQNVYHMSHQQVVLMIKANPTTRLIVRQSARNKTMNQSNNLIPITSPTPCNPERMKELQYTKVHTYRRMLEEEQKYIRGLKLELAKVPDVRKQAELEATELRFAKLQKDVEYLDKMSAECKPEKPTSPQNSSFLSGIPRSLSNLTGQSLKNLRQNRRQPALIRQNSDENGKKRHNNTVPMIPTTCLDNLSPPPLPPRASERPKPMNPMAKPLKYCNPNYPNKYPYPIRMHQSMPSDFGHNQTNLRRSSHSLDGELDGPQPNSIALQMNYPLVNVPPPSLQMDSRASMPPESRLIPVHTRSQSSPEHLDRGQKSMEKEDDRAKEWCEMFAPPPGTPPPPYVHNTQPCADPQRAIISMEDDDSPASDNSIYSGLFSNLHQVLHSKARMAVLLNWLLAEKRCACANLFLLITDGYRNAPQVNINTLHRWAYEIHSTFLIPDALMALNGVDENLANEIEHVLENDNEKEELLRNVFRKARQKAKDELTRQLTEFQVKRQVGLGSFYGPEDAVLEKCDVDKAQEQTVVEQLISARVRAADAEPSCGGPRAGPVLHAALATAARELSCRPATIAAAMCHNNNHHQSRCTFLQTDKQYKQTLKHITKQQAQPFVVRGHHLRPTCLTSVRHCHHCDHVICGLAPQAYVCTACNLRVHLSCSRNVEEACVMDGEPQTNRISKLLVRIHQDSNEKKTRKPSAIPSLDRSTRKADEDGHVDLGSPLLNAQDRRDESDESLYESADCQSDAISASDDAFPHLSKTPTISKESLKLAITDEEVELKVNKKGHRKAMSLSNPLEIVRCLGDEWIEAAKKELEKNTEKKKSRESLWSEEDRDHENNIKIEQRKPSKKEDKRKSNSVDEPTKIRKPSKTSSVSALSFLRRRKPPVLVPKAVDVVDEVVNSKPVDVILSHTKCFLEQEKLHAAICSSKPLDETDSDEEPLTPRSKVNGDRRRLSRQASRSKSKIRGKSQSVKVNTLRKSHSGTLKKGKKKGAKTPIVGRSRQASFAEPNVVKKKYDGLKNNSWLFSSYRGDTKREGSSEEPAATEGDADVSDVKDHHEKEHSKQKASPRGVARAESCRERDTPHSRRGKQRNASDPNRLTAPDHGRDLEASATTAPSGSSSSSSLSSRSNESNTPAEQQGSQSEMSEDEEAICSVWTESIAPEVLDSLNLSPRLRKRQEVIHELIVSEQSHVRWLKVLWHIFAEPLHKARLLSSEEYRELFPNLPAVRERHLKLWQDLKALRSTLSPVPIGPLAAAVSKTLSAPGYANCLSKFCGGQRHALDRLRERRRKNKELHQFLLAREQMPQCGRLQLRDLLACVWQRLTKYQLLLENILKSVNDAEDDAAEVTLLRNALETAKHVLNSVDTAIKNAENEHRLRSIQSKLEVRSSPGVGPEVEELRRVELPKHQLLLEGDLTIRCDNKKTTVTALMLSECLVLLHREGDKYILKHINTQSTTALSPIIKWRNVLFRANAAVKNTFFLMNINGVQMHELSTHTAAEYAVWCRHIQETPLAEARGVSRPLTQNIKALEEHSSGTSVSRNPSDASEKSQESHRNTPECPTETTAATTSPPTLPTPVPNDDANEHANEERHEKKVGSISTHNAEPPPPLEDNTVVTINEPANVYEAITAVSPLEQLRRLDETISSAMAEKNRIVSAMLGIPVDCYPEVAEMAVADTLGQVDVRGELGVGGEQCRGGDEAWEGDDMHQLLLVAQQQAAQLTERISRAISEGASTVPNVIRSPRSFCDTCHPRAHKECATESPERTTADANSTLDNTNRESFDMLSDYEGEQYESARALAARLLSPAALVQSSLSRLLSMATASHHTQHAHRTAALVTREISDKEAHARLIDFQNMSDDDLRPENDQIIQEAGSNGG